MRLSDQRLAICRLWLATKRPQWQRSAEHPEGHKISCLPVQSLVVRPRWTKQLAICRVLCRGADLHQPSRTEIFRVFWRRWGLIALCGPTVSPLIVRFRTKWIHISSWCRSPSSVLCEDFAPTCRQPLALYGPDRGVDLEGQTSRA